MSPPTKTLEDSHDSVLDPAREALPGVLVLHAAGRAQAKVLPLDRGALTLGRTALAAVGLGDERASREHVRIEREDGRWKVHDLGSRNGTFVDGARIGSPRLARSPVVRIGHTVLLPVDDCHPYQVDGVGVRGDLVVGPALAALHRRVAVIAESGASLLVLGPTGAGKERAAEAFHAATGGSAFVVLNCAAIPDQLAERMLFGARRGAYTGAVTDAVGLVEAARGGTLFLDEVAELEPEIQAKLLRVLETKKLTPLGAVSPVAVDFRLCAATHKDLRVEVMEGRFRGDLYFRVARPAVHVPPLGERREEIPWFIEHELASRPELHAGVEFVEACLLRAWPGNVRELRVEVSIAAHAARAAGRTRVAVEDLDDEAGRALLSAAEELPAVPGGDETRAPEPEEIEAALKAEQGNVARAALRLGVTRSRVRRLIERHGIDVKTLR
jgi:transcriptional regulator with GAF, ATPase, and Fis domain